MKASLKKSFTFILAIMISCSFNASIVFANENMNNQSINSLKHKNNLVFSHNEVDEKRLTNLNNSSPIPPQQNDSPTSSPHDFFIGLYSTFSISLILNAFLHIILFLSIFIPTESNTMCINYCSPDPRISYWKFLNNVFLFNLIILPLIGIWHILSIFNPNLAPIISLKEQSN